MRTLLLAVSCLVAVPAAAQTDVQSSGAETKTQQPSTPAERKPEAKKICKVIDGVESRLSRQRLCLTKQQWKEYEDRV